MGEVPFSPCSVFLIKILPLPLLLALGRMMPIRQWGICSLPGRSSLLGFLASPSPSPEQFGDWFLLQGENLKSANKGLKGKSNHLFWKHSLDLLPTYRDVGQGEGGVVQLRKEIAFLNRHFFLPQASSRNNWGKIWSVIIAKNKGRAFVLRRIV